MPLQSIAPLTGLTEKDVDARDRHEQ
jgi:hypothetical protein